MSGQKLPPDPEGDYGAYMRKQSKNALRAMQNAISGGPLPEVKEEGATGGTSSLTDLDALCKEIESQDCMPFAGKRIAEAVAKKHGLTFKQMISRRKSALLARPRQEAMYLMSVHTDLSLPQIGHILGKRDHTTVLHGIRVHAERLARGYA